LLEKEAEPAVRVVLGHFVFVNFDAESTLNDRYQTTVPQTMRRAL
jgi:hypothetical protein